MVREKGDLFVAVMGRSPLTRRSNYSSEKTFARTIFTPFEKRAINGEDYYLLVGIVTWKTHFEWKKRGILML